MLPTKTHLPVIYSSSIHNHPTWKHPKCSSTGKWMDRLWSIHHMDYYAAPKRNVLLVQQQHEWIAKAA